MSSTAKLFDSYVEGLKVRRVAILDLQRHNMNKAKHARCKGVGNTKDVGKKPRGW